jgi:hypothetical protein
MSMDDLKTLATRHGTDKWNSHWYAQHYERHFAPWRSTPVRLLEIGIGGYDDPKVGGQSLRMWKDYFPHGTIVGLDIVDKAGLAEDRIRIFRGSQTDQRALRRIIDECGPFDFVVDDGSHIPSHVIATFDYLFRYGLKEDGIYAVEDLQTSYWKGFGGSARIDAKKTSMAYFKDLCDRLNFREWHRPGYEPSYNDLHVVSLHFYHNLLFIQKGKNDEESNLVTENRAPLALRTKVRGVLLGHARQFVKSSLIKSQYGEKIVQVIQAGQRRRRGDLTSKKAPRPRSP